MNNKKSKAFTLIEISIVILVIGILIAAIAKGGDLLKNAKLAAAKSVTQSSVVNSMDGLTLWFETTMSNSFNDQPRNNDKVVTWNNLNPQITTRFKVEQTNENEKPTYQRFAINDLPAIYFNGANRLINNSVKLGEISKANENTIFVVQNHDSTATAATTFSWLNTGSYPQYRFLIHAPNSGNFAYDFGYSDHAGRRTIAAVPANFSNVPKIISILKNYSRVEIKIDGAEPFLTNDAADSAIPESIRGYFSVGTFYFNPDNNFKGLIAELIFFNRALTNDEIVAVEDYLSQKWSIKLDR